MNNRRTKLKDGTTERFCANESVIRITGEGKRAYLWIGNDFDDGHIRDNWCFATVSGTKTLENLAVNILKTIKSKHYKP